MSYIKKAESSGDTYNLLASQDGNDVDLVLDAAASPDSQVKFKAGTNITLTEAGTNSISIDAAGGSPGGSNTQVQFNDGGSFGGDSAFTFDKTASAERVSIAANTSDKILDVQQQAATDTLAFQVRSSSSQGLKVNNTGIMGIGIDPASGFAIKTAQDIQILGDVQHLGSDAIQDGSAGSPMFSRTTDKNTGVFFPGADQLGFSTGGSERLRFGSAGQIGLGGANYGASGEVLTSNGPSSAPTWQAGGGGGGGSFQAFSAFKPTLGSTTLYNKINLMQAPFGLYSNELATGSTHSQQKPIYTPFVLPKDLTITHLMINLHTAATNSGVNFEVGVYNQDANGAPSTQLFKSVFPVGSGSTTGDLQVAITNTGGTGALNGGETYWVGGNLDAIPGTNFKTARMADTAGSTGGLISGNVPFSASGMNNTAFRDDNATSFSGMPATVTISGTGYLPFNIDLIAIGAVFA